MKNTTAKRKTQQKNGIIKLKTSLESEGKWGEKMENEGDP